MKRFLLIVLVCLAAAAFPAHARAGQCGLPDEKTMWIDYADGNSPFWQLFARPGFIVGAANFIYPPQIRARGAKTVFFDLNFHRRMGTPSNPVDPSIVVDRANRLFEFAASSSACDKPLIALNELHGASTATPWSKSNATYRENVLTFVKTLAERGARPFLLIPTKPYTGGEAADWWREVAKYADLVRQVYFPAGSIHKRGPVLGSRVLRTAMRRGATEFFSLNIPPNRVGIMLGFQIGKGGRQGLQPASAWWEVVKWQALAAKQVASELKVATVWSWGWAAWSAAERDPDKGKAACVWLWTRDPRLCNVRRYVSPDFNIDLENASIRLPSNVRCMVGERRITRASIAQLTGFTGDAQLAFSALYQRIVESNEAQVSTEQVLAAERAIIVRRFGGSRARYLAALARERASLVVARGIIADELRKNSIKRSLTTAMPRATQIEEYYATYAGALVREVAADVAPWWLNGRTSGWALSTIAPRELFRGSGDRALNLLTMTEGRIVVEVRDEAVPLGSLPLVTVRPAIVHALRTAARESAYHAWTARAQHTALAAARCFRDQLPMVGAVELVSFVPFLALSEVEPDLAAP